MQSWRSCGLPHFRIQFIHCRFSAWPPPRTYVADQRLSFHNAHIGLFRNRQKIVDRVAGGNASASPVIRKTYLVNASPLHGKWTYARCDQRTRLNDASRSCYRGIPAVLDLKQLRHFWRDFAEEFWL